VFVYYDNPEQQAVCRERLQQVPEAVPDAVFAELRQRSGWPEARAIR
jgi:hypothetical protein